ncbi:MAG: YceI family protein [Sandaracinaceae bacterium]
MRITRSCTALAILLVSAACDDHTEGAPSAQVSAPEPTPTPTEANDRAPVVPDERREVAFDTSRSTLGFVGAKITASHEGSFGEWSGTARLGDAIEDTGVEITIQMASVRIDPERLNTHLRSPDFFDVERFPQATFTSTTIAPHHAGSHDDRPPPDLEVTHDVTGRLTLHGVSRAITFPARITRDAQELRARAQFTINRRDFQIVYPGMPDDLIQDEVMIRFDVVAPIPAS